VVVAASDVVVDRIEVETVVESAVTELDSLDVVESVLDSPDVVVDTTEVVRLVESVVELLDSMDTVVERAEVEMVSVAKVLDSPDVVASVARDAVVEMVDVETVVEPVANVLNSLDAVVEELNAELGRHKPPYAPMGENAASSVTTANAFIIARSTSERTPP
jgi:hypothetical protein